MKLKTAGILTMASVLFTGANANASNVLYDFYAGATIGVGASSQFGGHDNKTENAQSYGAVLGVDIPVLRIEGEYSYLNHDLVKMHVGMANLYVKMPSTVVHPYLGVGIGGVFGGDVDIPSVDIKHGAAYQGMLGLTFDVPALPIKIDAEARALYAPDIYEFGNKKPDILQYEGRLKLRYVF